MTDKGRVVSTEKDFAQVEVACFDGCHNCSAQSLCIGNKQNQGRLSVKNPIHALPGDTVKIQISEDRYNQALILLFGGLLAALFIGLGGGYLVASIFSLPSPLASFFGLALGLMVGGLSLHRIFRQKNKQQLYPVIVDIIKKGESYGTA